MLPSQDRITSAPAFNPSNPATWLKPDEPLIGTDGRDWSWAYVWFKEPEGFPGYRVGFDGSTWTCKVRCSGRCSGNWKPLKQSRPHGRRCYRYAMMSRDAKAKRLQVHRLVLLAFWGSPPSPEHQACHKDDNPAHNHFDNLKWGTPLENARQREDRDRGAFGTRHWKAKLTPELVREILEYRRVTGALQVEIAARFQISQTQVSRILRGESWRREFKDDIARSEESLAPPGLNQGG